MLGQEVMIDARILDYYDKLAAATQFITRITILMDQNTLQYYVMSSLMLG